MEEEYIVERIEKKRVINGVTQYFLKWQGYPSNQNSWEPAEHLYCKDLVAAFEKSEKEKDQSKKRALLSLGNDEKPNKEIKTIDSENNKVYGFDQGVEAKILGATMSSGKLMFLMAWKNKETPELVPATTVNVMCPTQVIQFYEDRLIWGAPKLEKGEIKTSPKAADRFVKNEKAN